MDSIILIGFSDGADEGYYIAADHPGTVKKLIAIGGNFGYTDFRGEDKKFIDRLSAANMENNEQAFVTARKALMPEPQRFDEFIDRMATLWRENVYVDRGKVSSIQCRTLICAGQNDGCPIEQYVALYRQLKKGQLAIIPGSDHLVLIRQPELMARIIQTFIDENREQK
jgi:pimeloyl-ACP methyl ester carboxylesterase